MQIKLLMPIKMDKHYITHTILVCRYIVHIIYNIGSALNL